MKALTFDQAMSVTGWAVGDENSSPRPGESNRVYFGTIKAPKREDVGERLAHIWREATLLIEEHKPDIIGYEEPFFPIQGRGGPQQKQKFVPASGFLPAQIDQDQDHEGGGGSRFNPEMLKQLQMVKGIIVTMAALRGIPVEPCTSSQWRVTVLGYGRKPKGESEDFMKKAVRRRMQALGFDVDSYDAADALGILYHTLHGKKAMERKQGDLLSMAGAKL